MLKIKIVLLVSIAVVSAGLLNRFSEDWTASEKADYIWEKILETEGSNYQWNADVDVWLNFIVPMSELFKPTDFVANWYGTGWTTPRRKTVHSKGALQKIRYVNTGGHSYTGLFADDNDQGLLRYSVSFDGIYNPAIAFKFYRDGVPSGNLQTMATPIANNTVQFMSGNFTNHIVESQGSGTKFAASKFAQASPYTFTIGTSHFALFDKSGSEVSGDPVFPFRIVFEPQVTIDETNTYDTESENYDFTDPIIDSLTQTDQLLFKVYAYAEPADIKDENGSIQIGEIYSQSAPIKSMFGDVSVQFFHNGMDRDFKYKPEWESAIPKMRWNWFLIDWEDETLNDEYAGWEIDTSTTVSSSAPHGGCPFSYF